MVERKIHIIDKHGLHAVPVTKIVYEASKYSSNLTLHHAEREVDLQSVLGILSLGIQSQTDVLIRAEGKDEEEAIENLSYLLMNDGIGMPTSN
ncbi:HPr family phosphocarrier protein [Bacillus sp. 03113]|uniref:HPr family phosphocarrier protein n=1 Tax=Bacillus sp. 03113 TaxID=2578211 RepID=UPI0011420820|nr:HPr family phosphocarrier protein [Bacillus sp. 03113]